MTDAPKAQYWIGMSYLNEAGKATDSKAKSDAYAKALTAPSDAAATRLLQRLHSSGLADAHVMPVATPAEPRRVSVGLFNGQAGAERRAREVKALGLTPVITEQHQPEATYWVDINLTSPEKSVSTEGLLPPAVGAHLEIRDCPAAPSSAPAPVHRRSEASRL